MNKVDFFSFKDAPDSLKLEWQEAIARVIASGRFIGGSEVTNFERNWAEYLKVDHAIGVANGLDAIILGLRALNIGSGSLVAVPSHTFIATWLAVEAVGATPIGIDCDSHGLMNLDILESSKLKFSAVIPVHMHGQMVDMLRLTEWAAISDVKVIEDCAQAHGAKIHGRYAGTWGDIGAFSFYPTKNLGALGDGGIVVTNDQKVAEKVRSLGNYGSAPTNKYSYLAAGINSRLDPIQAAVLGVNLKYLDSWNSQRQKIASIYVDKLSAVDVEMLVTIPETSVWHHFVVLPKHRDAARAELEKMQIITEIHYPECAEDSYAGISSHNSSRPEVAQGLAQKTLSLPMSPWMSDEQISQVLDCIALPKILRNFLGEI